MTARDLMRLVAERGGNVSALNVVIRTMREAFERGQSDGPKPFGLQVTGRGVNAHHLTPTEAAWVLICYAGSDVAAHGIRRLPELAMLQSPMAFTIPTHGAARWALQTAIDEAFKTPEWLDEILEVRIARNHDFARIVTRHAGKLIFCGYNVDADEVNAEIYRSYVSEGIIGRGLLSAVAEAMHLGTEA